MHPDIAMNLASYRAQEDRAHAEAHCLAGTARKACRDTGVAVEAKRTWRLADLRRAAAPRVSH